MKDKVASSILAIGFGKNLRPKRGFLICLKIFLIHDIKLAPKIRADRIAAIAHGCKPCVLTDYGGSSPPPPTKNTPLVGVFLSLELHHESYCTHEDTEQQQVARQVE